MDTFDKRMATLHKVRKMTQEELAKLLNTSISVIGKYERDEMQPSIEAAKKISHLLDTSVGFLLGESDDMNVLKDKAMLKRLNDISQLPDKDKECVLYTIDHLLASVKTELVYK
jgi:transcriptional regulator with XRE-family HTH domain